MVTAANLMRFGCAFLALTIICDGAYAAPPPYRRAQLDAIARKCGFPSTVLKLERGQLHIQPPANASYEKVDCLLVTIRKAGHHLPVAFVGNETYDPKER